MPQTISNTLSASVMFIAVLVGSVAMADDIGAPAEPIDIDETMNTARAFIEQGELEKAAEQLRKVVDKDKTNADAWNLLGYSWRKLNQNRKSKKSYARALKLDPNHKGALEYQGELFIKLGEREKANDNLTRLKTLCPSGCEELDNLTRALAGESGY